MGRQDQDETTFCPSHHAALLHHWRCALLRMAIVLVTTASSSSGKTVFPVEKHIFHSTVDHYNFRPTRPASFPLRYFVHQEFWNGTGPCFFYAGNEANIVQFINNTGFMFDAGQEFNAFIVFAEHRYYGESNRLPEMHYLTVEQAMADYNALNLHIRQRYNMSNQVAFIAVGGSYGANLAMWLRLKNPNLWAGAIASSATPLKHKLRETNLFAQIETEVYGNVSSKCPALVREGWKELYANAASEEGREALAKSLRLCRPISNEAAAEDVHGWLSAALETMVQYGYPYPSNFYNPLPAYPFRVACHEMLRAGTGLGALHAAANVYFNYTGQAGICFDFDTVRQQAALHWYHKGDRNRLYHQAARRVRLGSLQRQTRPRRLDVSQNVLRDDGTAWGYQTCTEVYQPMPTNGVTDFEVPYVPNQTAYYEDCRRRFGVAPRPTWEETTFMGDNIQAGSNIFLTNGELDPWRAAGIQVKPKGSPDSIIVRTIENGAHHLDLRGANAMDPPSVVQVREEEKEAMRRWILEWKEICPSFERSLGD